MPTCICNNELFKKITKLCFMFLLHVTVKMRLLINQYNSCNLGFIPDTLASSVSSVFGSY